MLNYDYIIVGNSGYRHFVENCIINIKKINHSNRNIFVYCFDDNIFNYIESKNYNVNLVKYYSNFDSNFNEYNSKNFKIITNAKFRCIKKHLEEHFNSNILYVDGDVAIIKEPNNISDEYDIIFSADADGYFWACTGYMYVKNNQKSKELLQKVIESKSKDNDQEILNDILDIRWRDPSLHKNADIRIYGKNNGIKLEIFNMKECYNGWYLQHRREEVEENIKNNKVISIHGNCVVGKKEKINLLKSYNKWYVE